MCIKYNTEKKETPPDLYDLAPRNLTDKGLIMHSMKKSFSIYLYLYTICNALLIILWKKRNRS